MPTLSTRFETGDASRYLQQLCKHFAHKVEAEWDEHSGKVKFEPGMCLLASDETGLTLTLMPADTEKVQQLIFVVEIHLVRFAWREDVDLNWTDETGTPVVKSEKLTTALAEERAKFAAKRGS